jgi:WD40 repeat protein
MLFISNFDAQAQQDYYKFLGEHSDDVEAVAVSPNGKYIATGSWDKTIKVFYNDSVYSWMCTLNGHQSAVTALAFSRDGQYLLSGGKDYKIILWKLDEGGNYFVQDTVMNNVHTSPITDVIIGPGMKMLYSSSGDGKVMMYDRVKRKMRTIDNKIPVTGIALSTNRRFIFVTDESTMVKQYDALGKLLKSFEGHTDIVNDVDYALNTKFIVTGSNDKTAIIWDALTGKQLHKLEGHDWKVISVVISPDSKYVLTGSNDGTSKLWKVETGELIRTFEGMGSNVRSVAFSVDQERVFVALHNDEENDEFGVVVWGSGIEKEAVQKPGQPAPLPKHLQKYAPKPNSPAASKPTSPNNTPKPSKKVIKSTDEVEISVEDE